MGDYRFAGLTLRTNLENPDLELFAYGENRDAAEAEIDCRALSGGVTTLHGMDFITARSAHLCRSHASPSSLMASCGDWTHSDLYTDTPEGQAAMELLLIAAYSCLARKNALFQHCSLVDAGGRGVAFVGRSGIGKTTQARLWNEFAGAEIINGDKAFVRIAADGAALGCGCPWKGSSPYCVNREIPLAAIVALSQGKENRIRLLSGGEAVNAYMPHVFLPHWDETLMPGVLDTLDRVLARVPVYELCCRPDEEAVRMTRQAVFGDGGAARQ